MADKTITQLLQITGEDKTRDAFDSVKSRLTKLDVAFGDVLGEIAHDALREFGAFVTESFKAVKGLSDLSNQTGITVADLSALEIQAKLSGTSLDVVTRSSVKLAQAMQEALQGKATPATAALHALGVTQAEVRDVANDSVASFKLVADKLGEYRDGAQKTAAIADIFGGKSTEINRLLALGADSFEEATKLAKAYGLELSNIEVKGIVAANDEIDKLELKTQGLARQIVAGLAPSIATLAKTLNDATGDVGNFAKNNEGAFDDLTIVVGTTLELVDKIVLGFHVLAVAAEGLVGVLAAVGVGLLTIEKNLNPIETILDALGVSVIDKAIAALTDLNKAAEGTAESGILDLQQRLKDPSTFEVFLQNLSKFREEFAKAQKKGGKDVTPVAVSDFQERLDALNLEIGLEIEARAKGQQIEEDNLQLSLDIQAKMRDDARKAELELQTNFLASVSGLSQEQLQAFHDTSKGLQTEQVQATFGALSTIFGAFAAHSKKALALQKAFAIADAIVNTAKGVTLALSTYPLPFGAVVAAAVVASGIAQIAKIRSAQPGGGSAGGGIASVGSGGGGVGEGSTGGVTSSLPAVREGVGQVTVVLEGHSFQRDQVIELMDAINEVTRDGAVVLVAGAG